MATIQGHMSVAVLDKLGVTASYPYYFQVDDATTVADIDTALQAFITDMDAVTDGQIVGASFDYTVTLPTVKTAPAAGSEVERGGLFNFSQSGIKYKFGVILPALKQSLIVNGKIDLTNTALQDWLALFTTIGGDAEPISTAGRALVAFKDAMIVFRKHRKAEDRRSVESA